MTGQLGHQRHRDACCPKLGRGAVNPELVEGMQSPAVKSVGERGHASIADGVDLQVQNLKFRHGPTGDGAREGAHARVADLVAAEVEVS